MRLFISYARVDKYICSQVADVLDAHDLWVDNRLHAGQDWWARIERQLEWCEGFVYLLSPDSVTSRYCLKEFEIAQRLGKHIFPILVQAGTPIPRELMDIQYVDISDGISPDEVKCILNSIYVAERMGSHAPAGISINGHGLPTPLDEPNSRVEVEQMIAEAADALDTGEYDRAVFLLKQARATGYRSRYIDLNAMLRAAEDALEWEAFQREARHEYGPIVALVRRERTRKLGCQAFRAFHRAFPDYDPENLAAIAFTFDVDTLEWCAVPTGRVKVTRDGKIRTYRVNDFEMAKYPVTNAQYAMFIDAPDGYKSEEWWDFSAHALSWRRKHPEAMRPRPDTLDHPCVNVCWYEAVAFCRWVSDQVGEVIALPTEQQWQRAGQADDGRPFPWGRGFDTTRCNTRESALGRTVPVYTYPRGVSAYGVFDMAGNAWEWCVNNPYKGSDLDTPEAEQRIIKGGSFIGVHQRAQNDFFYALSPECRYGTIGFRLVRLKN